ncbi:MAG: hypothetical protein PHF86_12070 [Candidatus Nanoarchaeia archaeon]|nr:hypothetical protein [Candidatus Nanoarchaeia archaeon]
MENLEETIETNKRSKFTSSLIQAGLTITQLSYLAGASYGLYELDENFPTFTQIILPVYVTTGIFGLVGIREGYCKIAKSLLNR